MSSAWRWLYFPAEPASCYRLIPWLRLAAAYITKHAVQHGSIYVPAHSTHFSPHQKNKWKKWLKENLFQLRCWPDSASGGFWLVNCCIVEQLYNCRLSLHIYNLEFLGSLRSSNKASLWGNMVIKDLWWCQAMQGFWIGFYNVQEASAARS